MRGGHPEAGVPEERKSEDQAHVQQRVRDEEPMKKRPTQSLQ